MMAVVLAADSRGSKNSQRKFNRLFRFKDRGTDMLGPLLIVILLLVLFGALPRCPIAAAGATIQLPESR